MSTRSQRLVTNQHAATHDAPQSPTTTERPAAMATIPTKLLVTAKDAACYLSVSQAHIYRLLQVGELRAVHTTGTGSSRGAMRIPMSELTSYVERLLRAATDADVEPR